LAGLVGGPSGHRKYGLPPGAVLERLPQLELKGKGEPVEAFVVHALRAG
jgi:hypothetical protein